MGLIGWNVRKSHNITGSPAGEQTDYQMKVTVYYGEGIDDDDDVYCSSKCKTDFGDIRFTESDGETELDYWMQEKIDSDYAVFWVEINTIPIDPGTATIYIYYGNTSATTTSSGDNTWILFDECDNAAEWSVDYTVGSPIWAITTFDGCSVLSILINAHNERLRMRWDTKENTGRENRRNLTRINHSSWNADAYFQYNPAMDADDPPLGKDSVYYSSYSANKYYRIYASVFGVSDYVQTSLALPSGWYVYETTVNADGKIVGQRDATSLGDVTVDGDYASGKVMYYLAQFNPGTSQIYVDWFANGKYIDPEPTHGSWGDEESSADLFAKFTVPQGAEDLFAKFIVAQGVEDLLAKTIIRNTSSADLLTKTIIRHASSADLLAKAIIRHNSSADLFIKFEARSFIHWARLKCHFWVRRVYDLSHSDGISFYWFGSDVVDGNQMIDFEMWSPTGGWVAKFPDGEASWRWVFLAFRGGPLVSGVLREVDIAGSRPDKSQIEKILWTYYSKGVRRIDAIRAWRMCDLKASLTVRHASGASSRNLFAKFEVRNVSSQDLPVHFRVATGQGFNDLIASFFVMVTYTSWSLVWTRDYDIVTLDGVYVDNLGGCYMTDDASNTYFRSYAGVEATRSDYDYFIQRRAGNPLVISEGAIRYLLGENEDVLGQFDIWRDGAIVSSINLATDLGADYDSWSAIYMSDSGKYIAFAIEGLSGKNYVMLYEGS